MGRRFLRTVVVADVIALFVSIIFATNRVFGVLAPWLVTTSTGSLMPSVVFVLGGASISM
jgi:hypothetical protein